MDVIVESVVTNIWGDYNADHLYFAGEDPEIMCQDLCPDLEIDGNVFVSAIIVGEINTGRRADILSALADTLAMYTVGIYQWAEELLEDKETVNAVLEIEVSDTETHFSIGMDKKSIERIRADIRFSINEWAADIESAIASGPSDLERELAFIEGDNEREKYLKDQYNECGHLDRTLY